MSLINHLLIDLEERRATPGLKDSVLADLKPANGHELRAGGQSVSPGTIVLCCSIMVVAVVGYLGYLGISGSPGSMPDEPSAAVNPAREAGPQDQSVMETQAAPPGNSGVPLPANLALRLDAQLAEHKVPVRDDATEAESGQNAIPAAGLGLKKISIDEQVDAVLIRLSLTGAPRYHAYILDNPERAVVELLATEFQVTDIAGLSSSTQIARVRHSQRDGRLVLVFDLSAPMRLEDAAIAGEAGDYWLRMRLAPVEAIAKEVDREPEGDAVDSPLFAVPSAGPRRMEKTPSNVAQDPADMAYQQGLSAFQAGRYADSERELRVALEQRPSFIEARYLLASAMLKLRRNEEAEQIVAQGLRLAPDSSPLRRLFAHIRFERGDVDGALAELSIAPPALEADPDYHAFVAALLERKGRYQEAMGLYRRLLALEPDNGIWWMGLGICLEALARNAEALKAYTYAMTRGSLPPDVRQFVGERVARLGQDS